MLEKVKYQERLEKLGRSVFRLFPILRKKVKHFVNLFSDVVKGWMKFFFFHNAEAQPKPSVWLTAYQDLPKSETMNIAVVTFDSLRFDVAVETYTPNFDAIFKKYKAGKWRKVFSQATYTLPSHISLFQGAITPTNFGNEPVYNRNICAFFKIKLPWRMSGKGLYEVEASANVVKGFEEKGYRTVGIGGVDWFGAKYETSNFWEGQFFKEFYWDEAFYQTNGRAFENQIEKAHEVINVYHNSPLFFFVNVPTTHSPYRGEAASKRGQGRAFQYIDKHFPKLIELLPKPCHLLLWSDHGECFGENNLWGHSFYHKKIIEVPMIHFIVR